tara:strand:+ start:150 stop:416 length:267 start_codon:yes stop_codon:yes gene_type:complete
MNVIVLMAAPAVVDNVNVSVVSMKKVMRQIMPKNLNCIGYPHDDPYGLSAAFWKIFTKPKTEKKDESNTPKPKKRINPKARKISRRSL